MSSPGPSVMYFEISSRVTLPADADELRWVMKASIAFVCIIVSLRTVCRSTEGLPLPRIVGSDT